MGLKEISIIPARSLSAGLPYDVLTRSQHFSEVPARLQHRFEYTLSTSNLGTEGTRLITINEPTAKLAGKNLSLSFSPETQADEDIIASYIPQPNPDTGEIDPAQLPDTLPGYLISLKAEFSINGDITYSASSGKMGEALYETMGLYSPSKGWFKTVNRPTAGEYRAIGLDLQGSSPEQAQQLQEQMEATKAVLESGNEAQLATLTKQQLVGNLLSSTIYAYFALNNIQDEIAAQTAKITTYRAPSFGVFRTNLNPVYWFGIARDVQFNGLVMDVDLSSHQTVANDNSRERWLAFNKAIGARGSAKEHLVPEQMFSTENDPAHGISAVKALSLASAQGQKIYTIDRSNLNEALSAINLSPESEAEIRAGVQAGKIATAHESQIEYHDWVGEGYIVIDPATGSGAYKIAGGDDGGWIRHLPTWAQVLSFIAIAAVATAIIATLFYFGAIFFAAYGAAVITAIGIVADILLVFSLYKMIRYCAGVERFAEVFITLTVEVLIRFEDAVPGWLDFVYGGLEYLFGDVFGSEACYE